jgi:hypothetical protein
MLVENLWTEHGPVSGAFGTVHDIIWKEGDGKAHYRAPFALLVKFDNYTGPGFLRTENDDTRACPQIYPRVLSGHWTGFPVHERSSL